MGFWNGRVTFTRYRVSGPSPLPFGEEILELARKHLIGQHGSARPRPTAISTGWSGGDHVLDLTLDLGKNIVDDALHLAIRDRHRQDPRSAAARLHPDRDRGPRLAQSQRHRDQGPETRGQGGRQAPRRGRGGRRPVSPAQPLPDSLGRTDEYALRRQRRARASSSGSRASSARPSTGLSSRSRPAVWPRIRGRRLQQPRIPARNSSETFPSRWLPATPARPRAWPGPVTTPPVWTTSATSFWSGSGTRFKTRVMPSHSPTART